jgi:two-component system cell cycle sensor histidine kinase/response regulator CckA
MSRSKGKRSVVRILLLNMMLISVVATAMMGAFWIQHVYSNFKINAQKMKEEYILDQKNQIRKETERVLDYVEYTRSRIFEVMKGLLRERVLEAHTIATSIYTRDRGRKSESAIKQSIKDTLRMIRFRQGRGYYYIYDMTGMVQLYPVKPGTEGQNHIGMRDNRGNYVVRNEIELVRSSGEGFIISTTGKSRQFPETMFPKVSFVKYFSPFDWYIGSREYLVDAVNQIQRDILERIGKIRFGEDGYIFVFDYDGIVLMNDAQKELMGRNLWEYEDANNKKVVQEMRQTVEKPEGGYVQYLWNRPTSGQPARKISYVKNVPDWRWIIGAGVYVDPIDKVIFQRKMQLESQLKQKILYVVVLILIIFAVVLLLTLTFSRRLKHEFDVFTKSFKQSVESREIVHIDTGELFSSEFNDLAEHANLMLREREKMEKSIRESQERLAVIFRSLTEGVIATDTNGKVTMMNRAAEVISGFHAEEVGNKSVRDVFDIHDERTGDMLENPVEKTLKTGQVETMGYHAAMMSRNGSLRSVAGSAAVIRDKDNRIIGAVMVFQDVTESRKLEENMQKNQKLEALGLLAGGIAHDFNNLLTGVLGNINLAKAYSNPQDKIHKPLMFAEKAAIRSRQLTQQLLTFAKGGEPIKRILDISQLIRDSIIFALRGSKVKAKFHFPEKLWLMEVDEGQMDQVFNNLAINSVQAMSEGGIITVTAENLEPENCPSHVLPYPERKHVKISIEDNGSGIPEDILPMIFDPYFTTKAKGSGLGLASVHSIIIKHEGIIEVHSEQGTGTGFTIFLPAIDGDAVGREEKNVDEEFLVDGNGRILVMDDDKMVADVLMRQLALLGYEVTLAHDGEKAIELYREALAGDNAFEIVLMDLTVPGGMGGADTIKKLMEIDPQVKAIVSSGYSTDPVMANFKNYGFKACIVKPHKLSELSRTLQEVIKQ